MTRRELIGGATLALWLATTVRADDASKAIAEALAKPVHSVDRTLNETRSFVEARIAKMPEVRSLDEWRAAEEKMRAEAFAQVIFRGEAAAWRDARTKVETVATIEGGPGYKIRKLRYEILPGFWAPALLYEPDDLKGKRVPVVLNVNGHDRNGKAADYKQIRCINLAKRGILALNVEWLGMGQFATPENAHPLINQIDLCGSSGVGVHYLAMSRALDVLLAHPNADSARVGLTGLSGGGWQTIFYSAFDKRITLSVPVAGYSSFFTRSRFPSDLGDSEQTPVDLGAVTDYAPMTAMLGGRSALLVFNAKDNCCFAADHALAPLVEAAAPIFKLYGREKHLQTHVNVDPGTHNYLLDNRQALYRMIGATFYPGNAKFDAKEIPSESEVKSADQLFVELPADNLSLHRLSAKLAEPLPKRIEGDPAARLLQILRADRLEAEAGSPASTARTNGLSIVARSYSVGREWTLPAIEFQGASSDKGTAIVFADGGKKSTAAVVEKHVKAGRRVVSIDPYNFGESSFPSHVYLWSLFVSTVGERPLGVQAGQVAAVARLLGKEKPVTIAAVGPRATTVALCAAGLETKAIGDLELDDSLESFKLLISQKVPYDKAPELFCFGLLESFDIRNLLELAAPRKVVRRAAADPFSSKK